MKATLLNSLVLTLSLCYTHTYAQQFCIREVPSFDAAPGGYAISGSAILEFSDFEALHLSSDFGTQSGPDLHVYLAEKFEAPSSPGNANVDLGELQSNTGAQSYILPPGIEIDDYDYVLIHCLTFNHWWGGGLLDTVSCTSATNPILDESASSIYPNPAADLVTLQLHQPGIERIIVLDVLGNVRLQQSISNQQQVSIDIHELENGLFFVMGLDEKGEYVFGKRVIKKNH